MSDYPGEAVGFSIRLCTNVARRLAALSTMRTVKSWLEGTCEVRIDPSLSDLKPKPQLRLG